MGYTPVKTVTEEMPWTAKDMNTYVRDNFAAGIPDLFTAKGDVAVATGADAAIRLGVGTNGYTLIADSTQATGVKWGVHPQLDKVTTKGDILAATAADAMARVGVSTNGSYLSANSGLTEGVSFLFGGKLITDMRSSAMAGPLGTGGLALLYSAELYDPDSAYSNVTPRYTVPASKDGYYFITAKLYSSESVGSNDWSINEEFRVNIYVNGVSQAVICMGIAQVTDDISVNTASGGLLLDLSAADYIEWYGYQNSGSDKTYKLDCLVFRLFGGI